MTRKARTPEPGKDVVALGFIVGLVVWYAGGSAALDRLLDIGPLIRFTAILMAAAALLVGGYEFMRGNTLKNALIQALLTAALCALLGSTLGALVNRYADSTPGRVEQALLTGFKTPTKGPKKATFRVLFPQYAKALLAAGGRGRRL